MGGVMTGRGWWLVASAAALLAGAGGARAQVATALSVGDVTASYSDAVDITATLAEATGGAAVAGANITFNLTDESGTFNVDLGQVATGPAGTATVRVPLVNGCAFLGNTVLRGGSTASPVVYRVEAAFTGDTLSGTQFQGSAGAGNLSVVKESVEVRITLGSSAVLGEMLTVGAMILDANGDAPCDRSALEGPGPLSIAGKNLAFFWDKNADGDHSDVGEALGNAMTTRAAATEDAEATVTTDTSAQGGYPRAGDRNDALLVQLSSADGQYLPATAVGRLVLFAAPPDALRTTLSADPPGTSAGGSQEVILTATLRDRFDNALGVDADPHGVRFKLEGNARGATFRDENAVRDPTTGLYSATLLSPSMKGTVTVRVEVDGTPGSALDIEFTGLLPFGPCACSAISAARPWLLLSLVFPLVFLRARRRSRDLV